MLTDRDVAALAAATGASLGGKFASIDPSVMRGIDLRWMRDDIECVPERFITLRSLERDSDGGESKPSHGTLLDSPRSAFLLLKNGLRVCDILPPDEKDLSAKAKLEGLSKKAEELRISAENDRRSHRLSALCEEYSALCRNVTREEVVMRVRRFIHTASVHNTFADNEGLDVSRKMKRGEAPSPSSSGPRSFSPMDSVSKYCVGDEESGSVLEAVQDNALSAARRMLRQRELKAQQQAAREHEVYQSEAESLVRSRNLDAQTRAENTERQKRLRDKEKIFKDRVRSIRDREQSDALERAKRISERESSVVTRLEAIKRHREESHKALQESRSRHRQAVREKDSILTQQRLDRIAESSEKVSRVHESALNSKRQEANERNKQRQAISSAIKDAVKEAQLYQQERMEARRKMLEQEATMRHEMFQYRREERLNAKRELHESRALQGRFSRDIAEDNYQSRLEALDTHRRERMDIVENARRKKEREAELQKEALRQVRNSKKEEVERIERAKAFSILGYASDSAAKDLEANFKQRRRKQVVRIARSEREAISRALQREVEAIDAESIVRTKDEFSNLQKV